MGKVARRGIGEAEEEKSPKNSIQSFPPRNFTLQSNADVLIWQDFNRPSELLR